MCVTWVFVSGPTDPYILLNGPFDGEFRGNIKFNPIFFSIFQDKLYLDKSSGNNDNIFVNSLRKKAVYN